MWSVNDVALPKLVIVPKTCNVSYDYLNEPGLMALLRQVIINVRCVAPKLVHQRIGSGEELDRVQKTFMFGVI